MQLKLYSLPMENMEFIYESIIKHSKVEPEA